MKAVIQRVKSARVSVNDQVIGAIEQGLLVFLGVCVNDTLDQAVQLSRKVSKLRLFADDKAPMNIDVQAVGGAILVVSQFTLHAQTKKGNRPSFTAAAPGEMAEPLYLKFVQSLREETGQAIETGRFGADMQVSLVNDGPVTIILDTEEY
jgi:D-tyrosyl-tRNA(Tyr) deacylase